MCFKEPAKNFEGHTESSGLLAPCQMVCLHYISPSLNCTLKWDRLFLVHGLPKNLISLMARNLILVSCLNCFVVSMYSFVLMQTRSFSLNSTFPSLMFVYSSDALIQQVLLNSSSTNTINCNVLMAYFALKNYSVLPTTFFSAGLFHQCSLFSGCRNTCASAQKDDAGISCWD